VPKLYWGATGYFMGQGAREIYDEAQEMREAERVFLENDPIAAEVHARVRRGALKKEEFEEAYLQEAAKQMETQISDRSRALYQEQLDRFEELENQLLARVNDVAAPVSIERHEEIYKLRLRIDRQRQKLEADLWQLSGSSREGTDK
jgi:hypothetical protein